MSLKASGRIYGSIESKMTAPLSTLKDIFSKSTKGGVDSPEPQYTVPFVMLNESAAFDQSASLLKCEVPPDWFTVICPSTPRGNTRTSPPTRSI